ncbi:MAG: hypothetical protein PHP98_02265 [Kiritimatiellae bacterium]|nr:hypothetical protein [Kiritimatiellia bacterium]
MKAERVQDIQALQADTNALRAERRNIARKVKIKSLPENERPRQLAPLGKMKRGL